MRRASNATGVFTIYLPDGTTNASSSSSDAGSPFPADWVSGLLDLLLNSTGGAGRGAGAFPGAFGTDGGSNLAAAIIGPLLQAFYGGIAGGASSSDFSLLPVGVLDLLANALAAMSSPTTAGGSTTAGDPLDAIARISDGVGQAVADAVVAALVAFPEQMQGGRRVLFLL